MRVASSHASRALWRPAAPRCMRSFRALRTVRSNVAWSRVLGPPVLISSSQRSARRQQHVSAQSRLRVSAEEGSGRFNGDEPGGARVVGEGRLPRIPQGGGVVQERIPMFRHAHATGSVSWINGSLRGRLSISSLSKSRQTRVCRDALEIRPTTPVSPPNVHDNPAVIHLRQGSGRMGFSGTHPMSLVGLVVLVFAYSRVIPRPSSQSCLSFLLRSRWVAVMFDASSSAARAHAALAEPVHSTLLSPSSESDTARSYRKAGGCRDPRPL